MRCPTPPEILRGPQSLANRAVRAKRDKAIQRSGIRRKGAELLVKKSHDWITTERARNTARGRGMNHRDYRSLIDRGRKAGLNTSDLYRALEARPAETGDLSRGSADGNGFQPSYDVNGHLVYKPAPESR